MISIVVIYCFITLVFTCSCPISKPYTEIKEQYDSNDYVVVHSLPDENDGRQRNFFEYLLGDSELTMNTYHKTTDFSRRLSESQNNSYTNNNN